MIDGGGYTASEISFQLACMKVLGTLRNSFSVKGWRVLDESDELGNRYVQASMSLSIGDAKVTTTRAEGSGPVDGLTKAMRLELEKWYPAIAKLRLDTFSVTAIDVSAHDTAARMFASRSASTRMGMSHLDNRRRQQRSEPSGADGHGRWLPLLVAAKPRLAVEPSLKNRAGRCWIASAGHRRGDASAPDTRCRAARSTLVCRLYRRPRSPHRCPA